MRLLVFDLETTGLDVQRSRMIELAAVIWDTEIQSFCQLFSHLIQCDTPIEDSAEEVHGISSFDLEHWGIPLESALAEFLVMSEQVDALLAHNGISFDIPILEREFRYSRFRMDDLTQALRDRVVIDSMVDIRYPKKCASLKLEYLAASHGFLNPFPHRALFDVMTLCRVISHYDLSTAYEQARIPDVRIIAPKVLPPWVDGGVSNDQVKESGFRWSRDDKQWWRIVKQNELIQIQESLGFETEVTTVMERKFFRLTQEKEG